MARQTEIRYIRYYTDGSVARQQERPQPLRHRTSLPKIRKQRKAARRMDPLSLAGLAISVVMLVLMLVGSVRLTRLQQENALLESYVCALENENAELTYQYRSNLDLEEIEALALSMGMIPQDQAQTVTIHIPPREAEETNSPWEYFAAFLAGLFA